MSIFLFNLILLGAVWGIVVIYNLQFTIFNLGNSSTGLGNTGRSRFWRWVAGLVVLAEFIYFFYLTREQFLVWHNNSLTQYLVPPYDGMAYFLQYTFTHWWLSFAVGLAMGLLFFWGAKFLNKRRGDHIFYEEEPYLLAIAIFLAGQPGWIVYVGLLGAVALGVNVWQSWRLRFSRDSGYSPAANSGMTDGSGADEILRLRLSGFAQNDGWKELPRVSYYHLWLPLAGAALIVTKFVDLGWLWILF